MGLIEIKAFQRRKWRWRWRRWTTRQFNLFPFSQSAHMCWPSSAIPSYSKWPCLLITPGGAIRFVYRSINQLFRSHPGGQHNARWQTRYDVWRGENNRWKNCLSRSLAHVARSPPSPRGCWSRRWKDWICCCCCRAVSSSSSSSSLRGRQCWQSVASGKWHWYFGSDYDVVNGV